MQPKPGVAFLAAKANVPIVPVAITGTERTMQDLIRFRRSPIRVEFGEPFMLSVNREKDRDASLSQAADEIMCQIARLLPDKYRGVYSDHSRLQELLNGIYSPSEEILRKKGV